MLLAADHVSLLTDPNDVSYVKATIADASGKVVTSSSAAVTFTLTGPGSIVAVDSGSSIHQSFRGNVCNAFNGVRFAIVQGRPTITGAASAAGPHARFDERSGIYRQLRALLRNL